MGMENKQGLISKKEADEVIRKLSFKAFEGEFKSVVIWMPENMNREANGQRKPGEGFGKPQQKPAPIQKPAPVVTEAPKKDSGLRPAQQAQQAQLERKQAKNFTSLGLHNLFHILQTIPCKLKNNFAIYVHNI